MLRAEGGGRIVTVSSDSAYKGRGVTGAHYASSKAALLTLTRRAAAALAASGVTANALVPGTIDGESVRELSDPVAEAAALPTGRLVSPVGLASLVALAALRRRGGRHGVRAAGRRRRLALTPPCTVARSM